MPARVDAAGGSGSDATTQTGRELALRLGVSNLAVLILRAVQCALEVIDALSRHPSGLPGVSVAAQVCVGAGDLLVVSLLLVDG